MNFSLPTNFEFPKIQRPFDSADVFEQLKKQIEDYEARLTNDQEIVLMLASFGQSIIMQVVQIFPAEPGLICFRGFVSGNESALVQHISQLNFLITVTNRENKEEPRRRIGFGES